MIETIKDIIARIIIITVIVCGIITIGIIILYMLFSIIKLCFLDYNFRNGFIILIAMIGAISIVKWASNRLKIIKISIKGGKIK